MDMARVYEYTHSQHINLSFLFFRQEINISNACREAPTSYNTRMNLELRAVIEDQWKKQLLEEMEREVKTNIEELEKKREQELTENIDKNSEKRAAVKWNNLVSFKNEW